MKRPAGIEGCSDHGCIFGHPGGMGTNGGCACEKEIRSPEMRRRFRNNVRLLINLSQPLNVGNYEYGDDN